MSNSKKRNAKMSDLKTAALEYHENHRQGNLRVELTKPTATSPDLSLAYSPGE
ncbi:malate dehydrogenase, partial [Pseudomonas koreensis]